MARTVTVGSYADQMGYGDSEKAILEKARARYKLANDADTDQDERERDDIAFYAGDQWPADLRLTRMGQQPVNGMPAVPSRPTLTINKVKEPVRQVLNQERASDIGIELTPADDFGDLGITPDDTEVTLREGLIRRIQRESIAADARTWAFSRAVIAGRGYYLVMTRFLPGKTWDQEIYIHRIYNQAGVRLDPSHEQPDGSDADWGFVGTWMPWDRYKAEFPQVVGTKGDYQDNPYNDYTEQDFLSLTEQYPDWYRADGENRAVRVTDYWYVTRESRELAVLKDGSSVWKDELPEGAEVVDTRMVIDKRIDFCKIGGGIQILEQTPWAGPDMPIVKVVGEELHPYDNQRRIEGMVRPVKEAGMGFNYMISKFVETVGLTPMQALQVDPDAIEGYESWYAVSNTRALPYLPYRTYDDQQRQLAQPHRPAVDPNILPMAQGIAIFNDAIQSTSSVPDSALGKSAPNVKSAKHAAYLIEEAQHGTSNYMDNLARACRYEAQIINNLLYPIYGQRPGRMVRVMTGEGEGETWAIGQMPMQGQTPQAAQMAQNRIKAQQVGKLTKDAHFNVAVKVTRNFDTRRQQESSALGELIAAEPTLMTWFGDLYMNASDLPNRRQLADRARVMLAPPIQQMLAKKDQGQQFDPAAQAEIAQLQQQIQAAEQAMQELQQVADGKQLDAQTKLQIEEMKAHGEQVLAELQAKKEIALEQMRAQVELEKTERDNATKLEIARMQSVDKALAREQQADEAALNRQHQTESEAAGMAHEDEAQDKALIREELARDEAREDA